MDNGHIVDDTPQCADTAGVVISSKTRAPGIRASVAQTIILKNAYELSSLPSSEQVKGLAEETGLPQKWIQQWFGRQRSKERKTNTNLKTGPKGPAAFSAAFFSDSASGAFATGNVSAREIMTIKLEYQDRSLTPSVSGSTNTVDLPTSGLPSEPASASHMAGRLDMTANADSVIMNSGTRRKKASTGRKNRKALQSRQRPKHAPDPNAQTKSTDDGGFRLLNLNSTAETSSGHGLNLSDGTFSEMDAYTQLSSSPISQECRSSTPSAPQSYLPRIFPPRRSPAVTSESPIGRETIIHRGHRRSRLSVVNAPMNDHQEDSLAFPISTVYSATQISSEKKVAFSVCHSQYDNPIYSPQDTPSAMVRPEARITKPVSYSNHPAHTVENRLSKAGHLAAYRWPDLVEQNLALDSCIGTFTANTAGVVPLFYHSGTTFSKSTSGYGRQVGAQFSKDATYPSAYLEALDPSRAPLKHLTSILTEYKAEDGTYFNLLVGLQYPAERRKIIERLSDEKLVIHNPFVAAMGLVLLSRLGVL